MKFRTAFRLTTALTSFLTILFLAAGTVLSYPVEFRDASGEKISIDNRPKRVVSLVPGVTEMIFKIGAGDAVKGVTYHDVYPPEANTREIVGGFFAPSVERIEDLEPDLVFLAGFHRRVREKLSGSRSVLVELPNQSMEDALKNILLLGKIFDRRKKAWDLVARIRGRIETIRKKVARIPAEKRKRVIRLMGRDRVMTPGDDSFQNEMIRAAGGTPPRLGKKGSVVVVTEEEWTRFNPQVIYGCGRDRDAAGRFFSRPGWKDVEAVRSGKIYYFPCDLTCRASTRMGDFVSSLASTIYGDEFSLKEKQVREEKVFRSRNLRLDLDYVKGARIAYSTIHDFENKTLIIDFERPMAVLSTLEGERENIESVGNHYSPPPCWRISHKSGFRAERTRIHGVLGLSENRASLLFTGADMDNLSVQKAGFRDMEVYALVTAGVRSNAVRMSADEGNFYEPGTVNIIILPNMKLTRRAMARAVITATESKTAALQDLDVRSRYSPLVNQATGTGTDNIIVVQGEGARIDNAGGHTKMGELMAKAVYAGVTEAVYRQNGLIRGRNIFQRLEERGVSVGELISVDQCECGVEKEDLSGELEGLLMNPEYGSFVAASLAISDDYERGLISDLSAHELLCEQMAERIAGRGIDAMIDMVAQDDIPPALEMTLNAILNGIYSRVR